MGSAFLFGTRKKLIQVTALNYVTGFKSGQRKGEREKINKKEKEKRNLTLVMVTEARKKNLVRKNYLQNFSELHFAAPFPFLQKNLTAAGSNAIVV